jgi:hypothetical protein
VLYCSVYCLPIAPPIVQGGDPTNRRDPRAPPGGFDRSPWVTARGKWRQWQRPIRRRSPSGQHHTLRLSGNVWHRSRARCRNGDFGPWHRDGGNRTLNEELGAVRR